MATGIPAFERNIDLMFCEDIQQDRVRVGAVAVVRRSTNLPAQPPDLRSLQPPPGARHGGGGSVGPFYLQFFFPQKVLHVNGVPLLTLTPDKNVVLLMEMDGMLEVVATETVECDFGAWDHGRAYAAALTTTAPGRLREALSAIPAVQAFFDAARRP